MRIADELIARGVAGPGGRRWRGTAIRAHRRGSGTLNNQAYIGLIVFNRLAYGKNPTTERQMSRENAANLHVVQEDKSPRIVDDALWKEVKSRQVKLAWGILTHSEAALVCLDLKT